MNEVEELFLKVEKFLHSQHLAVRAPSSRLPAAVSARIGVEPPRA